MPCLALPYKVIHGHGSKNLFNTALHHVPVVRHLWGDPQYEMHPGAQELFLDLIFVGVAFEVSARVASSSARAAAVASDAALSRSSVAWSASAVAPSSRANAPHRSGIRGSC